MSGSDDVGDVLLTSKLVLYKSENNLASSVFSFRIEIVFATGKLMYTRCRAVANFKYRNKPRFHPKIDKML